MTPRSRRRVVARCTVSFATPSDAASDRTDTAATSRCRRRRRRCWIARASLRAPSTPTPRPGAATHALPAPARPDAEPDGSAVNGDLVDRCRGVAQSHDSTRSSRAPSAPTAAPADTANRDGSPAAPTSRPTPDTREPAGSRATGRSATPRSPPTTVNSGRSTPGSDGTTCSDDDIVDQNYTHDIHTARPHPHGHPDSPDATVTNGQPRTPADTNALPTRPKVTEL